MPIRVIVTVGIVAGISLATGAAVLFRGYFIPTAVRAWFTGERLSYLGIPSVESDPLPIKLWVLILGWAMLLVGLAMIVVSILIASTDLDPIWSAMPGFFAAGLGLALWGGVSRVNTLAGDYGTELDVVYVAKDIDMLAIGIGYALMVLQVPEVPSFVQYVGCGIVVVGVLLSVFFNVLDWMMHEKY